MRAWQLQEAKAKLSELIKRAKTAPQGITVHGKPAVILISKQEYDRLTKPKISLVEFLQKSPLCQSNIDLRRDKSLTRDDVDL